MSYRVGHGFDAHRLVSGRPLWLGGVLVPYERGLAGHSDGDCLVHAVCDALLGSVAAGDMGEHFSSDDPRWKDAPSLGLLEAVRDLLDGRGARVVNVDATLIAEAPRLSPHTPAMRQGLARVLGVGPDRVSVKAKSTDGLGAVGRGEGIAAHAAVLVRVSGSNSEETWS